MANDEFRGPATVPTPTTAGNPTPMGWVESAIATAVTGLASSARTITAGTGLTGGGDLTANRTLAVAYGTAAGTAAQGNDARLSDARTPTTHAASHASGGGDPITPAAIGAAASSHVHAGADISSGTVAYARLPVGTAASTIAAGDDSRFTNARTPTAHAASHATGGGDAITPAAIGAIATSAIGAASGVAQLDGSALLPRALYYLATSGADGTIRLAGDLSGTGSAPTVPGIPARIFTAKGDLVAASGSGVAGRLPIGTDGYALVADAASTFGMKWAAVSGGGGGAPTGAAGGSLSGTYPNPGIAAGAITGTEIAAAIKDPAAATPGLRTLGTGAAQAAAGNDSRLSDARTPTAHVHAGADITSGTVAYARLPVGTAASTIAAGDDSRFTNARTPTAHAASHAVGQSDVITPRAIGARLDLIPTAVKTGPYAAVSGELVMVDATAGPITITLPALATGAAVAVKKVDASANAVTVAAAGGNTIGGQAAATTTISTQYQIVELSQNGASATNWAIVGGQLGLTALDARYALAARTITAGTGLTGGGNLTADRSLAVAYGTTAGTAAQGNDARLSDARTPTAHVHAGADITTGTVAYARLPVGTAASTVAAGDDSRITNARANNPAPRTASISGNSNVDCGLAGDVQLTVTGGTPTLTPTNGQEGRAVVIECLASGGSRTVAMAGTVVLTTGITSLSLIIPSGKVGVFVVRYSSLGTAVYELVSAYLRS